MKIVIIGGDRRMTVAHEELKKDFCTESLGLNSGDGADIESADVLLLPVPTTRDKLTVNCPLTKANIPLDTVYKAKENALILTAGYTFKERRQIDYGALDSFCILNAVATAEGAIESIIGATDFTLFGSKVLIIGFGRVGKILYSRLTSFGCDLTVSARNSTDLSYLKALGVKTLITACVPQETACFDIIINTVDVPLFSDISPFGKTYLFDLSSSGCLDFSKVNKEKAFKLPAIPGKTAPVSSGKIIAQTVKEIIRREF